jgi:hypothetical protein
MLFMKTYVVVNGQLLLTDKKFTLEGWNFEKQDNLYSEFKIMPYEPKPQVILHGSHPMFVLMTIAAYPSTPTFYLYNSEMSAEVRQLTHDYQFEIKVYPPETYFTFWSHEDKSYICQSIENEFISTFGDTRREAEREMESIIPTIEMIKSESCSCS